MNEMHSDPSQRPAPMLVRSRPLACRVVGLEDATADIRIVRLAIVGGGAFRFAAGQYAKVAFGDRPPRDYSMANRPEADELEFHIRCVDGAGASAYVARQLRIGDGVWVEGPYGDAWLRRDHRGPILAVAGGSGLAPMKSIVETALFAGMVQPIDLYFGVRSERDLYLEELFVRLAGRHRNFRFIPVVDQPSPSRSLRAGPIDAAIAADGAPAAGGKAYLAGPPGMVETVVALLSSRGMAASDIHADPFYSAAEQARRSLAAAGSGSPPSS